jgi:protein gp37
MNMEWARSLRDRCVAAGVAYFQKQAAAFRTGSRAYLGEKDGSCWEWKQWPDDMRAPGTL